MFFTASVLSAQAEWCSITFTRGRGKWEGGHIYSEHNWYNWEDGAPDTPENDYNELDAAARGILRDSYQHITIITYHTINISTYHISLYSLHVKDKKNWVITKFKFKLYFYLQTKNCLI